MIAKIEIAQQSDWYSYWKEVSTYVRDRRDAEMYVNEIVRELNRREIEYQKKDISAIGHQIH